MKLEEKVIGDWEEADLDASAEIDFMIDAISTIGKIISIRNETVR